MIRMSFVVTIIWPQLHITVSFNVAYAGRTSLGSSQHLTIGRYPQTAFVSHEEKQAQNPSDNSSNPHEQLVSLHKTALALNARVAEFRKDVSGQLVEILTQKALLTKRRRGIQLCLGQLEPEKFGLDGNLGLSLCAPHTPAHLRSTLRVVAAVVVVVRLSSV